MFNLVLVTRSVTSFQGSCVGDRPKKCEFVWTKCLYLENLVFEKCRAKKHLSLRYPAQHQHRWDWKWWIAPPWCHSASEAFCQRWLFVTGAWFIMIFKPFWTWAIPKEVVSQLWTWSTLILFSKPAVIMFPRFKHAILIGPIGFFQTCLCGHGRSSSQWTPTPGWPEPEEAPRLLGAGAAAAQEVS